MTRALFRVERLERNTRGRDLVCGDLHGMRDLLLLCLDRVGFDPERDRLFCCGDLVDRGPDSYGTVALLEEPWFHSVLGNHDLDYLFLGDSREDSPYRQYVRFKRLPPGAWYERLEDQGRKQALARLATLPIAIEIETEAGLVGVVHADVPKHPEPVREAEHTYTDKEQRAAALVGMHIHAGERVKQTRYRRLSWDEAKAAWIAGDVDAIDASVWGLGSVAPQQIEPGPTRGLIHIYHGHFTSLTPQHRDNRSFIDTGACYLRTRSWPDITQQPGLTICDITQPLEPLLICAS